MKLIQTKDYLLLIDEEAEIKENDLMYDEKLDIIINYKSYNDGCVKIIGHYPLTKEAKELDLPLLPPFEVGIEKLACEKYSIKEGLNDYDERYYNTINVAKAEAFIEGYKAAQSDKQFSLKDMKKAIKMATEDNYIKGFSVPVYSNSEEIIQSLSTQQLPKEFIPEYVEVVNSKWGYGAPVDFIPKTITKSEGKQEIQGTYKY